MRQSLSFPTREALRFVGNIERTKKLLARQKAKQKKFEGKIPTKEKVVFKKLAQQVIKENTAN
jgi:hypothetical protein